MRIDLLHLLAAAVFQLLHDVSETGHLLTVPVLKTLSHHFPQSAIDVALVHDFFRQAVHQLFSVQIEDTLSAVPLGVAIGTEEHSDLVPPDLGIPGGWWNAALSSQMSGEVHNV